MTEITSNTSALNSVKHYVHIHILLSNHMDLFWPYKLDDDCHWCDQFLENFEECWIVVDNDTTGESKSYSLQEVADKLYENFPNEFVAQ